jgi:hypothetical protein
MRAGDGIGAHGRGPERGPVATLKVQWSRGARCLSGSCLPAEIQVDSWRLPVDAGVPASRAGRHVGAWGEAPLIGSRAKPGYGEDRGGRPHRPGSERFRRRVLTSIRQPGGACSTWRWTPELRTIAPTDGETEPGKREPSAERGWRNCPLSGSRRVGDVPEPR